MRTVSLISETGDGMGQRTRIIGMALAAAIAGTCAAAPAGETSNAGGPGSLHHMALDTAPPLTAAGIPVSDTHVAEPVPALFAGTHEAGSALGDTAAPAGTLAELSSPRLAPSQAVRVTGAVPQQSRNAPRVSTAGPGPADPWALLCALAVVAYIAVKKLRTAPDGGWSERITPGNHL
jgi:hypothetical protein